MRLRLPQLSADPLWGMLRARFRGALLVLGGFGIVGAVVVSGEGAAGQVGDTLAGCLLFGAGAFALLCTQGLISGDLRRGTALLWLQKPLSPVGFYLRRFLVALGCGVGLTAISAVCTAGLLLATHPGEVGDYLAALPTALVIATILASITFAFSAMRIGPDALLTLLFLYLVYSMAAMSTVQPELFGPLGVVARYAAFPMDALAGFTDFVMGRPSPRLAANLFHLLIYTGAWMAVGSAALWVTTRTPFPREHSV